MMRAALILFVATTAIGADLVIPPGKEAAARDLIAGVALPAGYGFTDIRISAREIRYVLSKRSPSGAWIESGEVVCQLSNTGFAISTVAPDPAASQILLQAAGKIRARDTSGFGVPASAGRGRLTPFLWIVPALLFLAWVVKNRPSLKFRALFRPNHLMPAVIQGIIFGYWGLYWREVPFHLVSMAGQIVFAYFFDAALSLRARREWTFSFAPLPIVLSTNLFIWFIDTSAAFSYVVLAIAIASKHFIRRNGVHVFNPSAFAIALAGIAWTLQPSFFRYVDVSHPLGLPPNMTEVMFLLSLLPLVRFSLVLIPLGAALTLLPLNAWSKAVIGVTNIGAAAPSPLWPAILLAITLFATDPVTVPRTRGGRLLFGISYGFLMWLASVVYISNGMTDFFGKVLPIPILNWLAPRFDAAAERLRASAVFAPRLDFAYVVVWIVFVVGGLSGGDFKHRRFESDWEMYERGEVAHIRTGAMTTCAVNPVFCRAFSFGDEARLLRTSSADSPWIAWQHPPDADFGVVFGPLGPGRALGDGWTIRKVTPAEGLVRIDVARAGGRLSFVLHRTLALSTLGGTETPRSADVVRQRLADIVRGNGYDFDAWARTVHPAGPMYTPRGRT